jgi:hypothetical protein
LNFLASTRITSKKNINMFKKKENGFSLVELSVAAAVAVGLAVVAVTVVSGTAASVSAKGSSAASVESCTISESLAKAGGNVAATDCVAASSNIVLVGDELGKAARDASQYGYTAFGNNTGTPIFELQHLASQTKVQSIADAVNNGSVTKITATGSQTQNLSADGTTGVQTWVYAVTSATVSSSMYGGYTIKFNGTKTSGPGQIYIMSNGTSTWTVTFGK